MISNCNKLLTNKNITCGEKGKKIIFINNGLIPINKVKVDDCYQTEGNKCDYLFEILSANKSNVQKVYYVEFKGCRLDDALEQLISTINHCKSIHQNVSKIAVAVLSRNPKNSTGIQNMKTKLFKLTNSMPIIKNNIVEINI